MSALFADKYTSFWRSARKRHFELLAQLNTYDEYSDILGIQRLAIQILTYPKLARQLLLQYNAPLRLISRLCRTFAANAIPLPGFYATQNSQESLADLCNPDCTFQFCPSVLKNRLLALRIANREAWCRAHKYTRVAAFTDENSPVEQPLYPPKVLVWLYEPQLRLDLMPFECALVSVDAVSAILNGLLHVKPLAEESESCPEGWWDEVSRENFLAYFRCLLEILTYMQDMDSIEQTLKQDAEAHLGRLYTLVSTSALLASTDRTLLLSAIKETREAFEKRVGVIDLCFRVAPFTCTQGSRTKHTKNMSFQALGSTSEVYEYDVSVMRVNISQPLSRLLAALYGYGIEMGFHPVLLGLADEVCYLSDSL
ncbi:unnamed protein product [Dibothriocephalus latus]|uniref:Uncharacterized protein n=1 Tax=Dibothriocephalus latus TaxID=60516 RepID=A0A3P7MH98_DIBLA|nr:unnamed protein product [Dibothriocephalus latus]